MRQQKRTEWILIFLAVFGIAAGYLISAPVTLPHVPVAGGLIRAADIKDNFDACINGINSINDAQVAADAAIQGSKLAIGSIPANRLASGAFPTEESVSFSAGALTATFTSGFNKAILTLNGVAQVASSDYTHVAGSNICTFTSALPFSGVCTIYKF